MCDLRMARPSPTAPRVVFVIGCVCLVINRSHITFRQEVPKAADTRVCSVATSAPSPHPSPHPSTVRVLGFGRPYPTDTAIPYLPYLPYGSTPTTKPRI